MMIVFLFVKPVIVVAIDPSYAPSYQIAEEVIIKNGEFNDGLNNWVVSNPGSNNPALVTDESGNHYVMASNGENILQYVQLKPKTTYQFTYYVIGDPSFPAIVEFSTLNHGEGFISLKDERHYNDVWKQHEFSFTTPEGENTYIIRFASSGNGTAYFDNVQATALDLEAPTNPKNLKVNDVSSDSVSLSWEAATDNVGVLGYLVYRDNQLIQTVTGANLTYIDTGLMEDTTYTYIVKAVDQSGNISEASNTVTVRTKSAEDLTPPTPPLNLRIDDVTTNSVSLSWGAAIDNVGVTGYHVYRDDQLVQTLTGTELSYIDTELMEDTTYIYKIRAVDQAGNLSEASNAVKAKTKMTIEVSRPLPPTKLRSARVTEHEVALMWDAPNESKEIMSYQVYRNNVFVGEVSGESSLYTDKYLQENTKYSYVVKSKNKEGNLSEESNKIIVQTSKKHEMVPPLEEEIVKESSEKPPVAKESETKNNGAINKGKEDAKVGKQLPSTGSKNYPLIQILGLFIVSGTILLFSRRRKKSR